MINKILLSGALALTLLLNGCSSDVSLEINETTEQLKYLNENYPLLNITALDENYTIEQCRGSICVEHYPYKNGIFILNSFGRSLRNTDTMMGFIKADSCYFLTPSPQGYEQDEKSFYINVCFVGNTTYLVPDNSLVSGEYLLKQTNKDFMRFIGIDVVEQETIDTVLDSLQKTYKIYEEHVFEEISFDTLNQITNNTYNSNLTEQNIKHIILFTSPYFPSSMIDVPRINSFAKELGIDKTYLLDLSSLSREDYMEIASKYANNNRLFTDYGHSILNVFIDGVLVASNLNEIGTPGLNLDIEILNKYKD